MPAALCLAMAMTGCADFVVVAPPAPTPTPAPTLPPIGFNHRYGNSPVAAADGYDLERSLFAAQVFWEVGVRADPQLDGFVDRSNPQAVMQARARMTALTISIATERIHTIQGMLAFASDTQQEQYCRAIVDHFRSIGYSNITQASVLVFFTEQDEHAVMSWTASGGYTFKVNDNDLRGNSLRPDATTTPLPAPG